MPETAARTSTAATAARSIPRAGLCWGDGTRNDADRVEIGFTALAFTEWDAAGLALPDLERMRRFRWERLTAQIVARDYGALLMFDPLNIRYATDSTNMQLWNAHNPFRACLLCADGYIMLWDYRNGLFLSAFNPLVREVRSGADFFYFDRGDRAADAARIMAADIRALVDDHGGDFSIKLEDQVLITETGYENLTRYPFDDRLMGHA